MGLVRAKTGTPSRRQKLTGDHPLIPRDAIDLDLKVDRRTVRLTNLQKPFWPELGITKGDLLQLLRRRLAPASSRICATAPWS